MLHKLDCEVSGGKRLRSKGGDAQEREDFVDLETDGEEQLVGDVVVCIYVLFYEFVVDYVQAVETFFGEKVQDVVDQLLEIYGGEDCVFEAKEKK